MGSPCELHLYGESRSRCDGLIERAIAEVARLERKYSRYRDDSVTSAINRSAGDAAGVIVDAETASLLDYAATAHATSGGLFDPTSGVLRRVWNFKARRVPTPLELDTVLPLVGWQRLSWRRPRLVLPHTGMELDFGGFVKEYAADRVVELCRAGGARHGMVDLGGDLAVIAQKEPVPAPRDVARHRSPFRQSDLYVLVSSMARDIDDGNPAIAMETGGHDADGRVDLVNAGRDPPQMGQRRDDSDGAVAAHSQISGVVEENDARRAAFLVRLYQHRPDQDIRPARLAADPAPKRIEVLSKCFHAPGERSVAEVRASLDHGTRRLAAGMRVHHAHSSHGVYFIESFGTCPGAAHNFFNTESGGK